MWYCRIPRVINIIRRCCKIWGHGLGRVMNLRVSNILLLLLLLLTIRNLKKLRPVSQEHNKPGIVDQPDGDAGERKESIAVRAPSSPPDHLAPTRLHPRHLLFSQILLLIPTPSSKTHLSDSLLPAPPPSTRPKISSSGFRLAPNTLTEPVRELVVFPNPYREDPGKALRDWDLGTKISRGFGACSSSPR
ncbi:uncharacterized protein LOC130738806 [Lotus japonicus]|uniref:uncharacterized protein LOC130738806 n=1 Tax=Lotus japonicus TaxID=34305 RepID=UPI00258EABE5|nr:uncharacterized protein LOC130738806 [Lotus japonicus]